MRPALIRPAMAVFALSAALATTAVLAKLPPLSDDAKAKAAEAAAKAAHGNKVADFQLCKSMDKAASKYQAAMKAAGKEVKAATETPPCVEPPPFVAAAPASAAAAAPAASAPAKKS